MTTTRPSVLLVDDDAETLEALGDLLSLSLPQVEVRTERDPAKALERLRYTHVDLLIADFRMGPMDGLAFLERSREFAPKAKRILASAFPMPLKENDGVDLVLLKPLDTGPFLDRVSKLLELGS